jgi:MFS transporter, PAT family, beta-lactamase induction signal transducer AmpG
MGFMSGMTVLISGNTMNFWLTDAKIDKTSIGMFALVSLPYAINFIWSPLLDHVKIPLLNKFFSMRFSWIIVLQLLLSSAVYCISNVSPKDNLEIFALLGFIISFLSSTQDVALGALKSEIVPPEKQGVVSGIYIFGYRIGMLVGSSGAIYASVYMSWDEVYKIFALIIMYFPILLYITSRHHIHNTITHDVMPVSQYVTFSFWHKALKNVGPDNFITIMINPFLVETGFNALQIATVGKFLGISTAIIGGMIASYSMQRIKIIDALFYFGVVHALSHLLFIFQNFIGDNTYSLFFVIGIESTTGGMVMAAYIAFIASLCSGKYSATQYAFFSSMMGISRAIFPSISGLIVTHVGWNIFFLFVTILTIPPLWLTIKVKRLMHEHIA